MRDSESGAPFGGRVRADSAKRSGLRRPSHRPPFSLGGLLSSRGREGPRSESPAPVVALQARSPRALLPLGRRGGRASSGEIPDCCGVALRAPAQRCPGFETPAVGRALTRGDLGIGSDGLRCGELAACPLLVLAPAALPREPRVSLRTSRCRRDEGGLAAAGSRPRGPHGLTRNVISHRSSSRIPRLLVSVRGEGRPRAALRLLAAQSEFQGHSLTGAAIRN
jgi:hypothetical protein